MEMMRGNGCLVSDPPSMAMPRMVADFRMTTSDDSSLVDTTGRRLVYANQSPSPNFIIHIAPITVVSQIVLQMNRE